MNEHDEQWPNEQWKIPDLVPVWEEEGDFTYIDEPDKVEEDGRINLSRYFYLLPCQDK